MKKHIKKLYKSRKILLQALYGITLNKENNITDLIKVKNKNKININYLQSSINKITEKHKILELIINTNTKNYKNISLIEKLILKIATFEIFFYKNIPPKVIVNESIILTKTFCSQKSHKIINKILDKIIKNK